MDEDRQVIRRVLAGDVDAFEVLLRRYGARVFEYLGRRVPPGEVEGVAQEAFIRAFRGLEAFRGVQPFDHWLLRIAGRCSCDYWRKRKREMERVVIEADEAHHFSFDQALMGEANDAFRQLSDLQEIKEQIHAALNELDEEDRSLVEDVYFDQLSHREAAARRGCTPTGARSRLHRIRRELQRLMRPERRGPSTTDDSQEEPRS